MMMMMTMAINIDMVINIDILLKKVFTLGSKEGIMSKKDSTKEGPFPTK